MCEAVTVEIEVGREFLEIVRDKFGNMAPGNEVVLVVPRPGGKVLLHTKSFYPPGIYRLPTGRIHEGEDPEAAFFREFREELGQDGQIDRKLGVIRCMLKSGDESVEIESHVYLSKELTQEPKPEDEGEGITGFIDVPFSDLPSIAAHLRELPGEWRDWGRFRAVAHEVVARAMDVL